jgi:hypothetical protein
MKRHKDECIVCKNEIVSTVYGWTHVVTQKDAHVASPRWSKPEETRTTMSLDDSWAKLVG